MNQDDIIFEKHCREDLYFFCPLCADYHKKMMDKKTGEMRGHSLCQSPTEVESSYRACNDCAEEDIMKHWIS